MRRCCIVGCMSNSRQCPNLQFFQFPRPENPIYKLWTQACHASLNRTLPSKKPLVCALHFHPHCIGGKRLTGNAVPTLKLEVPTNLKAVEQKAMVDDIERSRKCAYINAVVYEWLVRANLDPQLRGSITHGMIKEKAEMAKQRICCDSLMADNRWLNRFRETHLTGFAQKLATNQLKPIGPSLWIPDIVQDLAHLFPPTSIEPMDNFENVSEQYVSYMKQYGEYEEDDDEDSELNQSTHQQQQPELETSYGQQDTKLTAQSYYQEQQQATQSYYQQQHHPQQNGYGHHYNPHHHPGMQPGSGYSHAYHDYYNNERQQQQHHYHQQQQQHTQQHNGYNTHPGLQQPQHPHSHISPPPAATNMPPQHQTTPASQLAIQQQQQQPPSRPSSHSPPQNGVSVNPNNTNSAAPAERSSPSFPIKRPRSMEPNTDIPFTKSQRTSPVNDLISNSPINLPTVVNESNIESNNYINQDKSFKIKLPLANGNNGTTNSQRSSTPNSQTNNLNSRSSSPKSQNGQTTNGHTSPTPSQSTNRKELATYTQALEYLKPLEDFALFKENFRAIGLISQLEAILKKADKAVIPSVKAE